MLTLNPYKLELQPNWVVLTFDLQEFQSQVAELRMGLVADKRFERYEYAVVTGEVVSVCKNLFYLPSKGDWHEAPLEYRTEVEVVPGDTVFYNYLSAEKAVSQQRVFTWEGRYYVFMRYDRLYAAIRSEQWVGINGWVIVEPVAEQAAKTGFVVERKTRKAKILAAGTPSEDYWDRFYPETEWLKAGDICEYMVAIPLQNALVSKYGDIRRVRQKDIIRSAGVLNPTVWEVAPMENTRMMGVVNTSLHRGMAGGREYLYCPEYQHIGDEGRVYVRRVDGVVEFQGEKLLMPL